MSRREVHRLVLWSLAAVVARVALSVTWHDKTWFVVLPLTGLLGAGLVGMIVCLLTAREHGEPVIGRPARPEMAGTS